jgi:hypothetical protein
MRASAVGVSAALHEVMFRFHLEKCRQLSDGDTYCVGCGMGLPVWRIVL